MTDYTDDIAYDDSGAPAPMSKLQLDIVNPNTMSPQQMLEAAIQFESEMATFAVQLISPKVGPAARIDGLARLAVAAEGVQVLVGEILRLTAPSPESLPFRPDFEEWLQLAINRTQSLATLAQRRDGSLGLAANAGPIVDVTTQTVTRLVLNLQALNAAAVLGAALRATEAELKALEEHARTRRPSILPGVGEQPDPAVRSLIADAAKAEESFSLDELEEWADSNRRS